MSQYIKRFKANKVGRDIVVGDIHGCFSNLTKRLVAAGFNPEFDRLFSCGDLVDRGPESHHAVDWLNNSWFHPVRGNHDDYVVRHKTADSANWIRNGGLWFHSLPDHEKTSNADAFSCLPLVIEVETANGLIGIVHADPSVSDWSKLTEIMVSRESRNSLMWSRKRVENGDRSTVSNVRHVICGHTPLDAPMWLGNVLHIDTAGWHKSGYFTLYDIASGEFL